MNILLSPPLAFLIYIPLILVIVWLGRQLAGPGKSDPAKTSFEALLHFFFKMHDPTTLDRQGNDLGSSYRSAIFYHSDEQKRTAEKVKALAAGMQVVRVPSRVV